MTPVYYPNSGTSARHLTTSLQLLVIARLDLVLDGIIARLRHLGLKVHVDELALLGRPLAIRVAVVDNLAAAGVADLDRRVGQRAVGRPLDVVAFALADEEGLGAADVALAVEAFLDGVVEDLAFGDGVACCDLLAPAYNTALYGGFG